MSGFDTSNVAAETTSTPFSAIDTMKGLAELNNAQNQNKLFQAKNLAGQYLEQSLGPDGQPDFNKLGQFLVNDKRTGPFALELLQGAKSAQNTGVTIAANQQALAAAKYAALARVAAAAGNTSQNPDQKARDAENARSAASAVSAAAGSGMFDPETTSQYLSNGNFIRASTLAGAGGPGTLEAAVGKPTPINTGPTTVMENINPALNNVTPMSGPGASVPMGLTPGEANTPAYGGYDPITKQPYAVTKGQAAVSPPHGPIVTGPGLGVEAAANTSGVASATAFNAAQQDVVAGQGRILTLKKSLEALKGSPTGPGTDYTNNIKSFLLAQGGDLAKSLPGIDPKTIANRDEANKYLTQYTLARANSLGPLTGEKLAAAITGNANTNISNLAAQDMVKLNIGLERMQQAGVKAFQAAHLQPQDYNTFISNWSQSVDPRAFMVDQLTKAERNTLNKTLSATDRTHFNNGVKAAISTGMYNLQDWPK